MQRADLSVHVFNDLSRWEENFHANERHSTFRPEIPVTLNLGMRMPAWFDLYGITPDAEEDENGINISTKMLHSMIDEVYFISFS